MKKRFVKRLSPNAEKGGFGWLELLVGVLFLIGASMAFRNPVAFLFLFITFIAVAAIIRGITSIARYFKFRDIPGYKKPLLLLRGIVDIIVGIIFFASPKTGIVAFTMLFSVWFMLSSAMGIIMMIRNKKTGKSHSIFHLITNIAGVAAGIFLLINPVTALLSIPVVIGIYMIFLGVDYFMLAFNRNDYY